MPGWLTVPDLPDLWPQAESIETPILWMLVDAAREQCIAYAAPTEEGADVPESWRLAHLMQVQSLWQSAKSGPGDTIGPDGLTITVYPMDRTVRNLLRPRRRVPVIG
jgi:hypothetical protein